MSGRRLYATLTGDGGGVKTRVDAVQQELQVRYDKDGRGVLAATIRVEFGEGDERPSISVTLHDADLAEVSRV